MNLLNFNFPDWFWVAFSLLVLVLLLKRFLWEPVNRVLEERQEKVTKAGQDAEEVAKLKAETESLCVKQNAEMAAHKSELMKEARSHAGKEYDRIVADAEKKAELILSAAQKRADEEYERMMVSLQKQIAATAMEAAALLLKANIDNEKNNQLLEAFLAQKDVLS